MRGVIGICRTPSASRPVHCRSIASPRRWPPWWDQARTKLLGDLVIHYEQRRVTVSGRHMQLTAMEIRSAPRALGQRGARDDSRRAAAPSLAPARLR